MKRNKRDANLPELYGAEYILPAQQDHNTYLQMFLSHLGTHMQNQFSLQSAFKEK
jgi:hypothetical protein